MAKKTIAGIQRHPAHFVFSHNVKPGTGQRPLAAFDHKEDAETFVENSGDENLWIFSWAAGSTQTPSTSPAQSRGRK